MSFRKRNNMKLRAAMSRGERTAKEEGCTNLPVDPVQIAEKHNILVQGKPDSAEGVSGALIRHGNEFGILYATHISSEGYQRFSIAHELGHYFLDGHFEHVFDANGVHQSRAGFVSGDHIELEADHFAAGLLMPRYLINGILSKSSDGLETVLNLSESCKTSLPASAIRYVELTDCAAAMVISSGDTVNYCFMSETLKNSSKELEWVKKGTLLPSSSRTLSYNENIDSVAAAVRSEASTDLMSWFGGPAVAEGFEEVVGLGAYGRTLTILTFPDLPDEEEAEEEEELNESWTPRF